MPGQPPTSWPGSPGWAGLLACGLEAEAVHPQPSTLLADRRMHAVARKPFGLKRLSGFLWLMAAVAHAQPGPGTDYVGAARCGTCHATEFELQSRSRHANSLHAAEQHPLAAAFPTPTPMRAADGFQFRLYSTATGLRLRAWSHDDLLDVALDWAFGAGGQGVTFVTRADENWYLEHSLSYFSTIGGLSQTPGHTHHAESLEQAVGVLYAVDDPGTGIRACFECHSSGPVGMEDGSLMPTEAGVRCEACHGPGQLHVDSASKGRLNGVDLLIGNPGRMPGNELNRFCGDCHRRPLPRGAKADWHDPWNTRHSPVYLAQSRCHQQTTGGVGCLTCHDPHAPLSPSSSAVYNDACRGCHEAVDHSPQVAQSTQTDCVRCHMPKVKPHPNLQFTNHWIGIYERGSVLQPGR